MIDRADVLVAMGLALLGYAIWSAFGIPVLLGFIGGVLIMLGILAAWRQGHQKSSDDVRHDAS